VPFATNAAIFAGCVGVPLRIGAALWIGRRRKQVIELTGQITGGQPKGSNQPSSLTQPNHATAVDQSFAEEMKRHLRNGVVAVALGFVYGVFSGVQRHGFVSSVVVFVILGLLYSALTHSIYLRMEASRNWFVRVLYSFGSATVIGFGLFGIFGLAESTVGWSLIYAVFDYAEPDPLGPGIATMIFCAGLGLLILLVDGITILLQVLLRPTSAAKREQ
jgi:hypothetical protein